MTNTPDNAAKTKTAKEKKPKGPQGVANKGKTWSWDKSKLKDEASIKRDEHLVARYLIEIYGHDTHSFAEICGCSFTQAQQMTYGRGRKKELRANLDTIAKVYGTTFEELLRKAQAWRDVGTSDKLIIHIRSLQESDEHYGFQQGWLVKNNLKPDMLFVIKQETNLLESENIQKGDALLVNKENTDFEIGAYYAGKIGDTVWVGVATIQHGNRYFSADPYGKKVSPEEFDALLKKGKILGRCVWRSSLM